MIYLPEKAVFIHVPRTGGMAFKRAVAPLLLGDHCGALIADAGKPPRFRRHSRAQGLSTALEEWNLIRRLLVVRNPWRWIESYWKQFYRYAGDESEALRAAQRRTVDLPFAEWVQHELRFIRPGTGLARHWGCAEDGHEVGVEFLKFEDPNHRRVLLDAFRLPVDTPIPESNQSGVEHKFDWTQEAIAWVQEHFADDFQRFGYPLQP